MPTCHACNATILFGGETVSGRRYCNKKCVAKDWLVHAADQVPQEIVHEEAVSVHMGDCPRCGGPGPVDVHEAYFVVSVLIASLPRTHRYVCCVRCARTKQALHLVGCCVFGWWGFPWGMAFTPVYIFRNIVAMTRKPDPDIPSDLLIDMVRIEIGAGMRGGGAWRATPPTRPPGSPE